MPTPVDPTLRAQLRQAVERAWAAAIASGALPAIAAPDEAPEVEVERPANPEHGDLATNLAMKLARPYRRAPLEIAQALADELAGEAAATPGSTPVARSTWPRPGSSTSASPTGRWPARSTGILAAPGDWGRVPAASPRSVNVEFVSANPTGPLTIGNARGAFVGDLLCRVLEAGGQQVTREYYFNDSGSQVRNLGASVVATRRGEPVPEDGYHGDYVARPRRRAPRRRLDRRRASPGRDADGIVGRWASERVRAGIEASLEHLGVHFDVWKTEASLPRRGLGRAGGRAAPGRRPRLRAGRGAVVPLDRLRRRQGPGDHPLERRADLLRGRHRLRDREVQPRLRPAHLHLGRRPPRDGRPGPQRRRGDGLRPGRGADAPRRLGPLRARRRGDLDVQAGRRRSSPSTSCWPRSASTPPAGSSPRGRRARRIDFDIELAKKQSTENPVYYVQYAHARIASILRKAAEAGLGPAASVSADGLLAGAARGGPGPRGASGSPRSSRTRPRPRRPRASRPTRRSWPPTFHAFYRDARVVDPSRAGRGRRPAWRSSPTTPDHAGRTRWACWGSRRPTRCRPAGQPARPSALPRAVIVASSVATNRVTRSDPSIAISA